MTHDSSEDAIDNAPPEVTGITTMSHGRNMPVKTCRRCGRPFSWRKKWERDWQRVVYCSDRCRQGEPTPRRGEAN